MMQNNLTELNIFYGLLPPPSQTPPVAHTFQLLPPLRKDGNMVLNLGPLGQQSTLSAGILGVGLITTAYLSYQVLRVLLSIFVLPGKSLSSFGPKGSYAFISGASDGIGKEFAIQLAKKGYNLILVSRTASKLDAVSSQIKSSSPNIKIETLAVDFAKNQESDYKALAELVKGKAVSILINSVGVSHSIPVEFIDTDVSELSNIINVNCLATLRITQTVLPSILPQKKGLILTMGSFGGLAPTPLLATYSGSKAFLQQWSNALAGELSTKGIDVYFVHSYLVTSAMSKIKRANWQVPSEKTFVRSVLGKIGRRGGSVGFSHSGSPYWSHALIATLITGVLGPFDKILLAINRSMHVDIRRRALRKAEREKGQVKKTT